MAEAEELVLHHYPSSPFAEKIRILFGIKNLTWTSLQVPGVSKGRITPALTGGYRRIPVLQIGSDFYCDTRLIVEELERRFPSNLKGTEALSLMAGSWFDKTIFSAIVAQPFQLSKSTSNKNEVMPGVTLEEFVQDRAKLVGEGNTFGGPSNVKGKSRVTVRDQLRAHLFLLEDMLSDGRRFLLGAEPSLLDAHAYAQVWFLSRNQPAMLAKLPLICAWRDRVSAIGHGTIKREISVETAKAIAAGKPSTQIPSVMLDKDEENETLKKPRTPVTIRPDDYGDFEVEGLLVASTRQSVTIERLVEGGSGATVRVHFPRSGFFIRPVKAKM